MSKSNAKKTKQLGIPFSTARSQLVKMIMWDMAKKLKLNICHQCNSMIDDIDELSIEHKKPWLDSDDPINLYFDLNNIAFSHQTCNSAAARRPNKKDCGTKAAYSRGCRCDDCKEASSKEWKKYVKKVPYNSDKRRARYIKYGT